MAKRTQEHRLDAARQRMAMRVAKRDADRIARHCTACGRWFMSAAQKTHHDAHAARLCVPRRNESPAVPGVDYDAALLPSSWRDRQQRNDAAVEDAQERAYEDNEARRIGLI